MRRYIGYPLSYFLTSRVDFVNIFDSSKNSPGLNVTPGQGRTGKQVDKAGATPSSADSVKFSPQSHALATQIAGSGAVFDTAKVQEIKAAIAEGTFKVNPERVADGLIDTVKDLINTRKA